MSTSMTCVLVDTKENKEVEKDDKFQPFSSFPQFIKQQIFTFLTDGEARIAMLTCREWAILNTFPMGNVRLRFKSICQIIEISFPRNYERSSYIELARRCQEPVLTSEGYKHRFGTSKPISISQKFLTTDAIDPSIEHGINGVQAEMKQDPVLKEIVDQVFIVEKDTMYTHSPVYHSMNNTVYLFGFSAKRFLEVMNRTHNEEFQVPDHDYSGVHWFRFSQEKDSNYPTKIEDFPLGKLERNILDDHVSPIKEWVLAVNPSLFCNGWTLGEGTWDMFILNKSVFPPNEESYFNMLCDQFGLLPDKKVRAEFAKEYASLLGETSSIGGSWLRKQRTEDQRDIPFGDRGNRQLGSLFQILIPRTIVNEVAYPCRDYGLPKDLSGKKMTEVHSEIQAKPHENYYVQARLMTSALVNPKNQIVTKTYGFPAFLETSQGKELVKKFDQFFLRVVAATVSK
ncbi:hypothetical protein [Simkania negevensis]|nr:hypothetical protein [Simkania negevensis]